MTKATPRTAAAVHLDERIKAVEQKLGRVSRIKSAVEDVRVQDRINELRHKIRHATVETRAREAERPKWAVRLADWIGGYT